MMTVEQIENEVRKNKRWIWVCAFFLAWSSGWAISYAFEGDYVMVVFHLIMLAIWRWSYHQRVELGASWAGLIEKRKEIDIIQSETDELLREIDRLAKENEQSLARDLEDILQENRDKENNDVS